MNRSPRSRVRLEICVDRLDSALAALEGGADRIEVCGALACGGVTPSAALISACVKLAPLEVMVMIRPHAGSFCYSPADLAVMERDIVAARQAGAHGVVFGALTPDRRIDIGACRRLMAAAGPLTTTFHRAFDMTRDPRAALDGLIELGVGRVLSSGQNSTAIAGAALLRSLVERSAGRIVVMPGAGVSAVNAVELLDSTGASELHASASEPIELAVPSESPELCEPSAKSSSLLPPERKETMVKPEARQWDFVFQERRTTVTRVRALRTAIDAHRDVRGF
ncbi:MAG: copper homeostasis protein CutC [Planctomycetota bacterium]